MRSGVITFFCLLIMSCFTVNANNIHHNILVLVNIPAKSIDVTDSIKIPASFILNDKDSLKFSLNSALNVKSLNPDLKLGEIKVNNTDTSGVKTKKYFVINTGKNRKITLLPLQYSGVIGGKITSSPVDYARGFSETSGIISDEGIYLAGSTAWIPDFGNHLFTFNLSTVIDSSWGVISQGTRDRIMQSKDKKRIKYINPAPSDEIYLIAGKWTEYNKKTGDVLVQAELRKPDQELADKYLDATIGYLELYDKLIGPYPYSKFTLVENFWETGFGMPSFTLLGETVIRLPFIITSSYPHELLHNYWGNSVYVNNVKGNWCEGLTVYMADHLMKEQQGQGAEYRRSTLQKYTDYVNEKNDFPVTAFRSRNNPAEEAIGYGKVMMIFEMLRYKFGDDVFRKAISKFYADNKFREASFDDIQSSFEAVTGKKLKTFFDQWLTRKGAPELKLANASVLKKTDQYEITCTILQAQKENPFDILVPIAIYFEGDNAPVIKDVALSVKEGKFTFTFSKRPVRIDIDPQFNVFRRLDKDEVPASISQIYGSRDVMMILPSSSPFKQEYSDLAEEWKQTQMAQHNNFEVKYDNEVNEIPAKSAWIVGFENKFATGLNTLDCYSSYFSKETNDQTAILKKNGGLVYVFQNSTDKQITNGFLGSNNQKMIAGLKKKVMYYTKYSYLGFEGDNATNKVKGEYPALSSPLSYYFKYNGEVLQTTAKLTVRNALSIGGNRPK